MTSGDEKLLERLRVMFAIEAEEHLSAISSGLLALEHGPSNAERAKILEVTFRKAHTLKGAARAVNLATVVRLCHSLENIFADLTADRTTLTPALFDLLHRGFALVREILPLPEGSLPADRQALLQALLLQLDAAIAASGSTPSSVPQSAAVAVAAPAAAPAAAAIPPAKASARQTIRASTVKLDALLHQAEELVAVKLTARQRVADIEDMLSDLTARLKNHAWNEQTSREVVVKLSAMSANAQHDLRATGKMIDTLLEDAKQVLMVPFSALFESIPQLVRDLSQDEGKEIDCIIAGDELEIDRRVQEEIKEALLHIIRNAIDHGIERPAERQGKPRHGTLKISVTQKDAAKAEIVIADDGAGIDVTKIRAAAQQEAQNNKDAVTLSDQEATALIFRPGFSTSSQLTDVSGRGLGLAIAAEKIESLGGTIAVESLRGSGTLFRLTVPMTMASFRGVLVTSGNRIYVIPTIHVERVARPQAREIMTVESRETIRIDGCILPVVPLSDALGTADNERQGSATKYRTLIIVTAGNQRIAFEVDAILAEQEVLMKGLGWQLARVPNIAGVTVLGTGKMALILNVRDLLLSAATTSRPVPVRVETRVEKRAAILVVEDSITARTLFRHVLEAAGYLVSTAVDGVEGWDKLEADDYALVVSDIEMPRMDGIGLTAKIRQNAKFSEIPVILISSDSVQDRERGMDAGANAYIVKKSFDQSDLLDIVRRFI